MHAPATLEAYVSLSWLTSFHSSAIEKGWSPGMRAILNCFGLKNRITVPSIFGDAGTSGGRWLQNRRRDR